MSATAKPKPRRRVARAGETKSETTRRTLLASALKLFQRRGVEATTMRDIAKAAKLSLGAAYYYFPSKEAMIFAYYEANISDEEAIAAQLTGTLREKLGALLHGKLDATAAQRSMLATIVPRLANPTDSLSAFSVQPREFRDRSIAVLRRPLRDTALDDASIKVVANGLWLLQLALLLLFVNDDSEQQRRTHGLVDDILDLLVPMMPLLATPMGRAMLDRIIAGLSRAGITL